MLYYIQTMTSDLRNHSDAGCVDSYNLVRIVDCVTVLLVSHVLNLGGNTYNNMWSLRISA